MANFFTGIGLIFVAILMIAGFALLMAFPTMWLWNWLMPAIFGLKVITFWQALGINFLCGILFKGSSSTTNNK
jgi:hypothetical protein